MFAYINIGIMKCLLCFSEPFFYTTTDRSVRASVYARTSLSTLCLHWTGSTTAQPALVALNVSFRCTIHSHSMSPRCFIHTTSCVSSPPPCQARASCWGSSRPPSSRLLSPVRSGTLSLSHTCAALQGSESNIFFSFKYKTDTKTKWL